MSTPSKPVRKNQKEFYSFNGDYGRSIKASTLTLEYKNDNGDTKESDLVEIKTTRNEFDKETKETKVKTSFVSLNPEQFREMAENFLAD